MKGDFKRLSLGALIWVSACTMQSGDPVVQARHVPERADDFAFENDKVAFRVYGPALKDSAESNGTDCWLKRVDYPIIDKWYEGHTQGISYHEDHGEGYDPYHVGSSLGCGGIALWDADAGNGDALIQPNVYTDYRVIEKTATKVVFELEYNYTAQNIRETKRITLEQGNQFYQAQSRFTRDGKPVQTKVAVGVTTHNGQAAAQPGPAEQSLTTWETIDGSDLGTGVILPDAYPADYLLQQSDQPDRSHALLVTQTDEDGQVTYYAGFGWARAGEIATFKEWQGYTEGYLGG